MTNVIFFRVGWMKRYQGISTGDKLEGGAKHLVENKWGHELFNFKEYNGYFYGYVPPANKRSRSIKLERINSDFKNAEVLHNVLIIWTATKNGGIYIVGWYKHADVYQYQQNDIKGREYNGEVIGYSTKAKMEDVVLLPIEERTYKIPYGKGWSGESHVWYAEEQEEFKEKVKRYVEAYKESKKSTSFIIGKEYVDNPDKQDEQEQNEFIAIEAEKTREEIISDLKGVTPKSPELVEVRGKQYRR
ncbi:MAG TPA: hypothetical protein VEP90_13415, partial [Methylomirabilota bacterium]|nr:hypothetical protein [Methylomirabilota bacterium]